MEGEVARALRRPLFLCIGGQEFVSLGEFDSENEADLSGVNVNSWRSRFILSKIVSKQGNADNQSSTFLLSL